jgi:tRNA G18 (ribose-2'-O)-methylase SpoU
MGAVFQLPIIETHQLGPSLTKLRDDLGFELVATVLDESAEPLPTFVRAPRTALLFGSEGHGLGDDWITHCCRQVTLPMSGGTDSLNVAVAAGVFLYHFCRVM